MERPVMFAVCLLLGAGLVLGGAVSCEPRPLEIEVRHTASSEAGVSVAAVSGTISNAGSSAVSVPNVRVAFRDQRSTDILVREAPPSVRTLAPDERATFSARIENPPPDAADVEVYLVGQRPSWWERLFSR